MENHLRWIAGFVVGSSWFAANIYFTVNILKISVHKKEPAKLSAMLLLKFPVLYLLGFVIITSRLFPVPSLLTGLMLALIITGILKLWPKQA